MFSSLPSASKIYVGSSRPKQKSAPTARRKRRKASNSDVGHTTLVSLIDENFDSQASGNCTEFRIEDLSQSQQILERTAKANRTVGIEGSEISDEGSLCLSPSMKVREKTAKSNCPVASNDSEISDEGSLCLSPSKKALEKTSNTCAVATEVSEVSQKVLENTAKANCALAVEDSEISDEGLSPSQKILEKAVEVCTVAVEDCKISGEGLSPLHKILESRVEENSTVATEDSEISRSNQILERRDKDNCSVAKEDSEIGCEGSSSCVLESLQTETLTLKAPEEANEAKAVLNVKRNVSVEKYAHFDDPCSIVNGEFENPSVDNLHERHGDMETKVDISESSSTDIVSVDILDGNLKLGQLHKDVIIKVHAENDEPIVKSTLESIDGISGSSVPNVLSSHIDTKAERTLDSADTGNLCEKFISKSQIAENLNTDCNSKSTSPEYVNAGSNIKKECTIDCADTTNDDIKPIPYTDEDVVSDSSKKYLNQSNAGFNNIPDVDESDNFDEETSFLVRTQSPEQSELSCTESVSYESKSAFSVANFNDPSTQKLLPNARRSCSDLANTEAFNLKRSKSLGESLSSETPEEHFEPYRKSAKSFSSEEPPLFVDRAVLAQLGGTHLPPLTTAHARARSYVFGNTGHTGSLLGNDELNRFFPDSQVTIFVGTWNMNGHNPPKNIDDFLLPLDIHSLPDIYAIGVQESMQSRFEWEVLLQSTLGPSHVLLASSSLGVLHLSVFVRRDLVWFCSEPEDASVATRPGTMVKTKGAVGVCFMFFGTSFLFVNSHLAAHEQKLKERLMDYEKICASLDLPKSIPMKANDRDKDVTSRFDVVLWCGDLNFRVMRDRPSVLSFVEKRVCKSRPSCSFLVKHDQLYMAMQEGSAFSGFKEGVIHFNPSYKFEVGTNTFTSIKLRVPSYTDRILYRSRGRSVVACLHYDAVPDILTSDHKPVFGVFRATLRPGRDNVPLAAGMFKRDIYLEALKRRSQFIGIPEGQSTVCSIM